MVIAPKDVVFGACYHTAKMLPAVFLLSMTTINGLTQQCESSSPSHFYHSVHHFLEPLLSGGHYISRRSINIILIFIIIEVILNYKLQEEYKFNNLLHCVLKHRCSTMFIHNIQTVNQLKNNILTSSYLVLRCYTNSLVKNKLIMLNSYIYMKRTLPFHQ